jgi:tRNA A-37 threonylcarbamoyl transferase component Bud32
VRLALERWRTVDRSLRRRFWALAVAACAVLFFASFWILLGAYALAYPEKPSDTTVAVGVMVVGGAMPAAVALGLALLAAGTRRRAGRLRSLAEAAHSGLGLSPADVGRATRMSERDAERLLFDAFALGVLADERPGLGQPPVGPAAADGSFRAETGAAPGIAQAGTEPASWPTTPVEASLVGKLLNGTYEVEARIGVGGMSEVYAARHARTGRRYAVKALVSASRLSEDAVKRLKREATAASAIGHPGIATVFDFDVTPDGIHYIVTELLEGETLEARMGRTGPLAWHAAAALILEVASALEAAHSVGVLHRDLKPSNVFLCPGRVVLLDFGVAKLVDDPAATKLTTTGTVVGTPLYMSPEQARSGAVDERSDVYGLGAVLYEVLTGAPPFLEPSMAALYARLLHDPPAPPSSRAPRPLPEGVDALLASALAKEPADRFESVGAFAAATRQIDRSGEDVGSSGVRLGKTA